MYQGATLSTADKDMMLKFMWKSMGRVLTKDDWEGRPVPQGVSVFNKRGDRFEYMFTKDEKYSGGIDWREDRETVLAALSDYTNGDYMGVVLYMNGDALRIASKHMRFAY